MSFVTTPSCSLIDCPPGCLPGCPPGPLFRRPLFRQPFFRQPLDYPPSHHPPLYPSHSFGRILPSSDGESPHDLGRKRRSRCSQDERRQEEPRRSRRFERDDLGALLWTSRGRGRGRETTVDQGDEEKRGYRRVGLFRCRLAVHFDDDDVASIKLEDDVKNHVQKSKSPSLASTDQVVLELFMSRNRSMADGWICAMGFERLHT